MAIRIKRQKNFGGGAIEKAKKAGKAIKDFYGNNKTAYLTTITAGASTSNLALNLSRKSQDKEYQDKQIAAMKDLTGALSKVDETLKKPATKKVRVEDNGGGQKQKSKFSWFRKKSFSDKDNTNGMIKFRRKDFSILSDTISGASIGATVGTISLPKFVGKKDKKQSDTEIFKKRISFLAASTILGAGLGALVGIIKEGDKFINRKTTVDNRLMDRVVDDLEKTGFKEGENFTRDPKTADRLKVPVSIAITKNSGELRILVNTVADNKLRTLTKKIVKTLPNSSTVHEESKNRYNEFSLTTISDGSGADVGLIAGICEKFIREKYPVYLVEVG